MVPFNNFKIGVKKEGCNCEWHDHYDLFWGVWQDFDVFVWYVFQPQLKEKQKPRIPTLVEVKNRQTCWKMWIWVKRPTNARHRRLPALWVGTISRLRSSVRRRCPSLTGSGTNWRGRTSLWGMPSTSPLRWISWLNKPPPMRIYVSVILGGVHSGEEGCVCYFGWCPFWWRGVFVCYTKLLPNLIWKGVCVVAHSDQ